MAFFAQTSATFFKNLIITLVFEKNAIFLQKHRPPESSAPKISVFRRRVCLNYMPSFLVVTIRVA
jgi:hypothetical protein